MNTKKHKHKNRPKINPANAETVKSEELVQEKSEIDTQIPVSEVIDVPLPVIEDIVEENKEVKTESEDKEAENEPTKPKRNKNKKKKQGNEKCSPEIKEEDKVPESVKTEDNVVPESLKIDTEVKEVSENEPATASVTPSARKKKNKKKNQEKGAETKVSEDVEIIQKESEAIVPVAPQQSELEVKELPTSPEPTKQDAKKKKNKKKNRSDSERSDKSESCTSAFQKLLTDEELPEIPAEGDNPSGKDTMTVESIVETILDDIKSPIMDIIEQTPTSAAPEEKETQKEQNKSKKKNKKDKKHAQKDQELLSPENVELPVATKEEPLEIIQEPEIKDEASPKPKAKIAKPVEKKRKDKHLSQSTENVAKESEEIKKDEIITPAEIPKETSDIKPIEEVKLITDIVEPIILNEPVEEKNTETTPVPEKTSKKGKKSPKIPVVESIEPINVVAVEVIQKPEEIIEKPIESNLPKCESKDSTKTEEKVVITPEIKESLPVEQKPEQTEIKATEDNIKFEEKTGKGKKKKKSPKTPTQVEPLIDVSTPEQSIDESKKQGESKKEVTQEAKTDIKTDTSKDNTVTTEAKDLPSIDIEVRSLRADESEGSSYDITPDVHFQRSSSQQLLDDNNNSTVIQEVCDFEDFKFTDPVPKPLIEGSGSTPLGTPELISSGIKIEEKKSAEKETVKSKMMEVNKDMEELRLSIERSLAEFTAMEKKEQDEQKIEDTKTPQEKIVETPTEQKQEIFEPEPIKPQETVNIVQEESKCSTQETNIQPCPPRKDKKGKQKKKGKESTQTTSTSGTSQASTTTSTQEQEKKTDSKESQEKGDKTKQTDEKKGKQQSDAVLEPDNTKFDETGIEKPTQGDASLKSDTTFSDSLEQLDYEPIDSFEDALTSSMDDVNKTFEMIAQDAESENKKIQQELSANKPEINITKADDTGTDKDEKVNPVSQPKNLLGHKDIPVPSNRTDYKKEKNKTPNEIHAKVKIKDSEDVEKKISKESQTDNKKVIKKEKFNDSFSQIVRDNEEYVYKYSFRKVFLQSACQICKKSLTQLRVPCGFCNLVFYCSPKHKDEDYSEHQALCFAVSTIVHLKGILISFAKFCNV